MTPQLRFPDFTDEWQVKKLGDIFDVRDGTHESPAYFDSGKPLLTSKNLSSNGTLNFDNISYISQNDFESINRRSAVDVGDILFGMIGTIGNPVKVDTNDFAIKNVALLKPKSVGSDYLIQYLRSQIIEKQFYQKNTGGTQKFIALGDIRTLKVSTPTKPEQEKIADFLTAVDERIAASERECELLTRYKRGVMQQLFSQKIRFKKPDKSNYPDWEGKRAGELFTNISNRKHNGDLPILSVTQEDGIVRRDSLDRKIDQSDDGVKNYKKIEPNDFVISLRSFQGGIEMSNVLGISSPAYTVLRGNAVIVPEMFKHYFKRDEFISKLNSTVIGIRDGKQISYEPFSTITLPVPSIEEQQKIADFLTTLDDRITAERAKLTTAKQFKNALLQRMLV